MRPHEKLDVWKKAIDFVLSIYEATQSLPKDEKFGLTAQLRRAAVSIPANIAEGAARKSTKEFMNFLVNCSRLSQRGGDRAAHRASPGLS